MSIKSKADLTNNMKRKGVTVVSVTKTTMPSRRGGDYMIWGYHAVVRYEGSSYSVLGTTHQELYNKIQTDIIDDL